MDTAIFIVCAAPMVCIIFVGALMILPVVFTEIRDCLDERNQRASLASEIKEVRTCIRELTKVVDHNNIMWSPIRATVELANTLFANPIIFGNLTNDDKNTIYEAIGIKNDATSVVKFADYVASILKRIES
jgi:hypothetical protein